MGRGPEQASLQRELTDGQRTHDKMPNILIIREMQIRTATRWHLSEQPWPINQASVGGDAEKRDPHALLVGWQMGAATKRCGGPSKMQKQNCLVTQ